MKYATSRLTETPLNLLDVDADGFTPLRRWRESSGLTHVQVAERVGVSIATYYRYEHGFNFNMKKANRIVQMTRGAIRYRDLIKDFNPDFA